MRMPRTPRMPRMPRMTHTPSLDPQLREKLLNRFATCTQLARRL
jgi:hypothetical protein